MHGELLARAGQTAEAAAAYGRAAIDPQDPAWLLRLGDLLCQLKRWQEAIPIFDEFLALSGDNVEALLLRGVALANTGRVEAARASLEQALALSPGDSRVRQALDQLEGLEKRAASQ
jgi:Flp pilus assembly protein TadD